MKKVLFIFFVFSAIIGFSQEKLLTKKIVYKIDLTENTVKSDKHKDSIIYNYKINQRFFWEAMDLFMDNWKGNKIKVLDEQGKTIVWDTMLVKLNNSLAKYYNRKLNKKEVQNILENYITKINFKEEWTYNTETMLINKKVLAFCPIISIDSLFLTEEGFEAREGFSFPLGWLEQTNSTSNTEDLLITRNIHYTIPIYNYTPYRWWENNLEEEYSIPYFDRFIQKAENMEIPVFENPDMTEALQKSNILKRRKFSKTESMIEDLGDNNIKETDTILNMQYQSEDFEYLRFGEEIYFNKNTLSFTKNTNYIAPIIAIKDKNGTFLYYYPIYYIRKK